MSAVLAVLQIIKVAEPYLFFSAGELFAFGYNVSQQPHCNYCVIDPKGDLILDVPVYLPKCVLTCLGFRVQSLKLVGLDHFQHVSFCVDLFAAGIPACPPLKEVLSKEVLPCLVVSEDAPSF